MARHLRRYSASGLISCAHFKRLIGIVCCRNHLQGLEIEGLQTLQGSGAHYGTQGVLYLPICLQEVSPAQSYTYNSPLVLITSSGAHPSIRCPSKHVDRANYEYSTGNLKRHVDSCEPDDTPKGEKISAFAHGVTYTPLRMRLFLALWCARHHRPYAIVEDPELQNIFCMLYAKVKIPSRSTVSRDVQLLHREMKSALVALLLVSERRVNCAFQPLLMLIFTMLQGLPLRIHVCVNGWTSSNVLAFLGITVHWHWEGKIHQEHSDGSLGLHVGNVRRSH